MIPEQSLNALGQFRRHRYCKQFAHDTDICGVDGRGECRECARIWWRRYYRLKRAPGKRCLHLPRLGEFRKMRGLTQRDLALAAGVSWRTVENVEGGSTAQRRTRENMADALGVNVRQLMHVDDVGRFG